jgi:poly(A) polymerase
MVEAVTRKKRRPSLVQRQYFHDALVFLGLSVKARGGDGGELLHWQRLAAITRGNGGATSFAEDPESSAGPRRKKRSRLRRRDDERPPRAARG